MTKRQVVRLVAAVTTVLALAGREVCAAESERDAEEAIQRHNGKVVPYDTTSSSTTFKTVIFLNSDLTDFDLTNLEDALVIIPVKKTDLRLTKVTGAGLASLAKLPNLTDLDLSSTLLTDVDLEVLSHFRNLEKLSLDYARLTDEGLQLLCGLDEKKLTGLSLSGTAVTDAGLRQLGKFTHLTMLNLSYTAMTDAGLGHLGKLTDLTKLDLSYTAVSHVGLGSLLEKNTSLTELRLAGSKVMGTELPSFLKPVKMSLKALDLSNTALKDTIRPSSFAGLTRLETLILSGTGLTDNDLGAIGKIATLVTLDFSFTAITNHALPYLNNFVALQLVAYGASQVTAEGISKYEEERKKTKSPLLHWGGLYQPLEAVNGKAKVVIAR